MSRISDGPARWAGNFPRKGWSLLEVIDLDGETEACEFCGTSIRYVFVMSHQTEGRAWKAGCVCAEHLSEDYITPKLRLKALKKYALAEDRRAKVRLKVLSQLREGLVWCKNSKGNFTSKHPQTKTRITVFSVNTLWGRQWKWVYNGDYPNKSFLTPENAMQAIQNLLYQQLTV